MKCMLIPLKFNKILRVEAYLFFFFDFFFEGEDGVGSGKGW